MRALWLLVLGLYRLSSTGAEILGVPTTTTNPTKLFYAPNPGYDPYWKEGHWVFGSSSQHTVRYNETKPTKRYRPIARFMVCGRPCKRVFRKIIGEVCVHKLDNVYQHDFTGKTGWRGSKNYGVAKWSNDVLDYNNAYLRDYASYCEFLDAQCRTNVAHGYGYAFLHMGRCVTDDYAWPSLAHGDNVKQRKRNRLEAYYKESHTAGMKEARLAVGRSCQAGEGLQTSLARDKSVRTRRALHVNSSPA